MPNKCSALDSKTNLCIKCAPGSKLNANNICQPVITCGANQYINRNSICINGNDKNCQDYDVDGICIACK